MKSKSKSRIVEEERAERLKKDRRASSALNGAFKRPVVPSLAHPSTVSFLGIAGVSRPNNSHPSEETISNILARVTPPHTSPPNLRRQPGGILKMAGRLNTAARDTISQPTATSDKWNLQSNPFSVSGCSISGCRCRVGCRDFWLSMSKRL
jgi:hypothetical protein